MNYIQYGITCTRVATNIVETTKSNHICVCHHTKNKSSGMQEQSVASPTDPAPLPIFEVRRHMCPWREAILIGELELARVPRIAPLRLPSPNQSDHKWNVSAAALEIAFASRYFIIGNLSSAVHPGLLQHGVYGPAIAGSLEDGGGD